MPERAEQEAVRHAVVTFGQRTRTWQEMTMRQQFGMTNADEASMVEMMAFIKETDQRPDFLDFMAGQS